MKKILIFSVLSTLTAPSLMASTLANKYIQKAQDDGSYLIDSKAYCQEASQNDMHDDATSMLEVINNSILLKYITDLQHIDALIPKDEPGKGISAHINARITDLKERQTKNQSNLGSIIRNGC